MRALIDEMHDVFALHFLYISSKFISKIMLGRLTPIVAIVFSCLLNCDDTPESYLEYDRAIENLRDGVIGKCTLF